MDDGHKERCIWKAVVLKQPDDMFQLVQIDDFGIHSEKCISKRFRFTPTEVTFQEFYPYRSRSLMAKLLKQIPVDQTTITMRKHRRKTYLTNADRKHLERVVRDLVPFDEVCNLPINQAFRNDYSIEAYRILQLLTKLERDDHARAKAFFMCNEMERLCLSMMTFIWPEGLDLLKTHSDAIFCDSMWSINEDGDHILTIVVVDREEKLRLAASAIAFRENKEHWELFFRWVKDCVKEFDPGCIVTDGADFIHTAFTNAVKPNVLHAICWWHKNRAVKKTVWYYRSNRKKFADYGVC